MTEEKQTDEIKEVIGEKLQEVRKFLQRDGGDLELVEITEDYTVKVRLQGACHGCPAAMHTLKFGVEKYLKERIPQVKEVQAV